MFQLIPFNHLIVSPDNVRTISVTKQADKELLASIEVEGLLQNLIVKPQGNRFAVVGGGRRFSAIGILVQLKKLPKDHPVPCVVKSENATVLSTLENVQRAAMHPADEFRAFSKMVGEGKSVADVAKTFGIAQKLVRQRLALGSVSPKIMEQFEKDRLDLDDLMAFTIVPDHQRQEDCFAALSSTHNLYERAIRKWLTGEAINGDSAIAIFVGAAAYKKAGGTITTDLFSTAEYWNDTVLAHSLVEEKLMKVASDVKAVEGWAWVQCGNAVDTSKFLSVHPANIEPPAELQAAYIELRDYVESKGEAYQEGSMSEEEEADYDAKCDELDELECQVETASQTYTESQKSYCGIVVTLDASGEPRIRRGLAVASDVPAVEVGAGDGNGLLDVPEISDGGRQLSQSLQDDLGGYRKEIVKASMLRQDALALDVLRYTLCAQVLYGGYEGSGLLSIQCRSVASFVPQGGETGSRAADELSEAFEKLNTEWVSSRDPEVRLQAFLALPEKMKRSLTTYCVTQLLQVNIKGSNKAQDGVIDSMGVQFHDYWRPTAENYFSRITKAVMVEQFGGLRGPEWVASCDKAKKSAAAADLDGWMKEQPQWMPEQF
ncbi:MAG: hypothetical protein A3H44_09665 [Gammaproteobacteria bacterium RIFCSPLOWO2_02_FULL_57_10]|nr:MAG: hypothetical protein A3H44_09665 [Gammaproteobacteria bacterium RIFCSPLOWO2_02_FULL_57_10]